MASKESQELEKLYRSWTAEMATNPDMDLPEIRRLFSHWGDVTADPKEVDYIETKAEGIPIMWAIPHGAAADRVLLCSHGGGYVVGSIYSHRKLFGHIAKAVGCHALIVDYRLAPEHPHPAPVDDMATIYKWLIIEKGIDPSKIALTGDSAGGALALTTIVRIQELGLPLPAATMPMSPWAGYDVSGQTYDSNKDRDALVSRDTTNLMGPMFIGSSGNPKDPTANPLYIDYSGFPPIYLQVGDAETLLDDSRRIAEKSKKAGVDVKIDIFPEMQHVFQFLAGSAPEADDAIHRMSVWVRPKLGL